MKPRFTFQTLILAALAPVLVAFAAFWAWHIYRSTHRIILDGFDRKLLAVAGGAAALIDGDEHARYQRGAQPPGTEPAPGATPSVESFNLDDPFYRANRAAFSRIQSETGLSYLYTQVYVGDRKIYYVLDGTVSDRYSVPGSVDELPVQSVDAAERVQGIGRSSITPIIQWQVWGLIKSGFTPIRDSKGRVVAIAGADVDIGIIRQKTRWALFASILIGVGSLLAAGYLSYRVTRSLTRPLRQLKDSALWIAAGYYGARIQLAGTREVVALAGTLDALRDRLDREETRSRTWQEQLRGQRQGSTLAKALGEVALRHGAAENAEGAEGVCRCTDASVWWFGQSGEKALPAACQRARLTVLVRSTLNVGAPPEHLLAVLLSAHPGLSGCACWHRASRTLHYRLQAPRILRVGVATHRLSGAGALSIPNPDNLRWAEAPAGAEPHETGRTAS
ncbi:hypothetical protein DB347_21710 [Opitutaceae bacterium EW11]|nr:hypothetical protein DB347_21710 [Opitutaceae bacterium EW11]